MRAGIPSAMRSPSEGCPRGESGGVGNVSSPVVPFGGCRGVIPSTTASCRDDGASQRPASDRATLCRASKQTRGKPWSELILPPCRVPDRQLGVLPLGEPSGMPVQCTARKKATLMSGPKFREETPKKGTTGRRQSLCCSAQTRSPQNQWQAHADSDTARSACGIVPASASS
jgi:hypothetical protein